MNRNLYIYILLTLSLISCGRPNKVYDQQGIEREREAQELKHIIDSALMKAYMDADYHVEVSYPNFFAVCDTTEDGTARFYYPSEQEQRIALKMLLSQMSKDGISLRR